jgi:tRNA pseudouridine55 synthase
MPLAHKYNFIDGELLLIDKPLAWTSFDVVNKIRRAISRSSGTRKTKVGHAGTLDPLATGLLLLCTGKLTKQIDELQLLGKEYTGSFILGATTPSFDKETEVDQEYPIDHISRDLILEAASGLTGEIEQVPPAFSAIKVDGTRAYRLARKNDEVKINPRKVIIDEFEITGFELPMVFFRISCSKGTYIRSVARDFGKAMNSGAYLATLRRTRIGNYRVEDAMTIEDFIQSLVIPPVENS